MSQAQAIGLCAPASEASSQTLHGVTPGLLLSDARNQPLVAASLLSERSASAVLHALSDCPPTTPSPILGYLRELWISEAETPWPPSLLSLEGKEQVLCPLSARKMRCLGTSPLSFIQLACGKMVWSLHRTCQGCFVRTPWTRPSGSPMFSPAVCVAQTESEGTGQARPCMQLSAARLPVINKSAESQGHHALHSDRTESQPAFLQLRSGHRKAAGLTVDLLLQTEIRKAEWWCGRASAVSRKRNGLQKGNQVCEDCFLKPVN